MKALIPASLMIHKYGGSSVLGYSLPLYHDGVVHEVDAPGELNQVRGDWDTPKPCYHKKLVEWDTKTRILPVVVGGVVYPATYIPKDEGWSWYGYCYCSVVSFSLQWAVSLHGVAPSATQNGRIEGVTIYVNGYRQVGGNVRYVYLSAQGNKSGKISISYSGNGRSARLRSLLLQLVTVTRATMPIGSYNLDDYHRMAREVHGNVSNVIQSWMGDDSIPGSITQAGLFRFSGANYKLPSFIPPNGIFGEGFRWQGYPLISMGNYWWTYMRQHAFLSMCETIPKLNDNSISNILEFGAFIYNLVVHRRVEIPKSLTSAWLSYRYQYMTTKLDIEEAIKFMGRHADEYLRGDGLKSYGVHQFTYHDSVYGDVDVTCRCTARIRQRDLSTIKAVWHALERYGLTPDFYVIWDMIPYSFIVDWFVPVGDVVAIWDAERVYNDEHYEFRDLTYSVKYVLRQPDGLNWSMYYRWIEKTTPGLSGYYWLEDGDTSQKVKWMRFLDTISLLMGRA